jgi:membrane-bound acyltransferase YfiQ involved in biofilm formation
MLSLIHTLYNSLQHALSLLSLLYIVTGCHLVMASNAVASAASVFMTLPAGDSLTTK